MLKVSGNSGDKLLTREASMSDTARFGELMGDFLRGLLGAPSTFAQHSSEAAPTRKWAVVDASDVNIGTMVSLDLELDPGEIPGQLTKDVEAFGIAHFKSGETCFLNVVVAKDYANAISLVPAAPPPPTPASAPAPVAPIGPEEVNRKWNLVAEGDVQPYSSTPYEVTLLQRIIPGTDITRIGGQIFDPKSQQRVSFSVTHDPVEYIILAVVAGFAALICGGVVLGDDILNRGKNRAREHCGDRGVKRLTIKRKYGFGWKKGAVDVGCGEDYIIECNPPPGPPVLRSQSRSRRSPSG
jgi:hypothetical protein